MKFIKTISSLFLCAVLLTLFSTELSAQTITRITPVNPQLNKLKKMRIEQGALQDRPVNGTITPAQSLNMALQPTPSLKGNISTQQVSVGTIVANPSGQILNRSVSTQLQSDDSSFFKRVNESIKLEKKSLLKEITKQ